MGVNSLARFAVVILWSVLSSEGRLTLTCTKHANSPTPEPPITDYQRVASDGRVLCVKAVIRSSDLGTGKSSDKKAQAYVARMDAILPVGYPRDDAGHLVAKRLGGTSADYNLVPQNSNCNRGRLWKTDVEGAIYDHVNGDGATVTFIIHPVYTDASRPNRPAALEYEWESDKGRHHKSVVPNPAPPATCS